MSINVKGIVDIGRFGNEGHLFVKNMSFKEGTSPLEFFTALRETVNASEGYPRKIVSFKGIIEDTDIVGIFEFHYGYKEDYVTIAFGDECVSVSTEKFRYKATRYNHNEGISEDYELDPHTYLPLKE